MELDPFLCDEITDDIAFAGDISLSRPNNVFFNNEPPLLLAIYLSGATARLEK